MKNDKLISKSQQRLRSKKHNVFTEEFNKIALSANNDNKTQSIDSIKTYVYGTRKDILYKKRRD